MSTYTCATTFKLFNVRGTMPLGVHFGITGRALACVGRLRLKQSPSCSPRRSTESTTIFSVFCPRRECEFVSKWTVNTGTCTAKRSTSTQRGSVRRQSPLSPRTVQTTETGWHTSTC